MRIEQTFKLLLGLILFSLVSIPSGYGQLSLNDIKDQADEFYKRAQYDRSVEYYERVLSVRPDADLDLLKLGASYFYTNQLGKARTTLVRAINTNQKKEECYFYLARVYHLQSNFKDAVKFYKLFLQKERGKHDLSTAAIEHLKRCNIGEQLTYAEQYAFVENLGRDVNSIFDERRPIPSPNVSDKIYFNSSREGNRGGPLDENGETNRLYGRYRSDMLSAQLRQGIWSGAQSMNSSLNTSAHEYLLDFQASGQIVHFARSDENNYSINIDTFIQNNEPPLQGLWEDDLGIDQQGGIYFFNDTTLLLSSRFLEGYGGYDIYIRKMRAGVWSLPVNLGPVINTPYDEISPFLTPNGRNLYFSSNGPNSMGGFDLFTSQFIDDQYRWSDPDNLRAPLNSPGDDVDFRMSSDGIKAWFASRRAESAGGYDLYSAYFKETKEPQFKTSQPITFDLVQERARADVASTNLGSKPQVVRSDIFREFTLSPIFYDENDYLLGTANLKIIDQYINLLKSYPSIRLQLTAHSDGSAPEQFDEYFSVKRAEKLADYIGTKGVSPGRVLLRGVGMHYPVIDKQKSRSNNLANKLHRRIEVDLLDLKDIPIQIKRSALSTPPDISVQKDLRLTERETGLSYRIVIARTGQPFTQDRFTSDPDPLIYKLASDNTYTYTIGLYKNFLIAESVQGKLKIAGFYDAEVQAFIDGKVIGRLELEGMTDTFPDLFYYLNSN